MSKQYNSYTKEFKKTIVSLYESGKKVAELVSEYDLEKKLIYNWIKKYRKVKTEAGFTTNNDELLKLKKENMRLQEENEIMEIYTESKRRYGSPKIQKILASKGIRTSQKRVARRMRKLGIRSIVLKKYNYAGNKRVDDTNNPNLLEQNFKAIKTKEKWVGDITYIYIKEIGWTYLAIVMDLYDLKIIGYSYGKHMTANLVIQALNNAICNVGIEEGMIFHSDLRSQYTSNDYEKLLKTLTIKHSYSKKARLAIFEFIESWYNNKRIHSSLGYITPNEKERLYYEKIA